MTLHERLESLGISVTTGFGMDKDGLYLPELKLIFVNNKLSDIERENAILHELGHLVSLHEDFVSESPAVHLRQEGEADCYMIRARAEEYLGFFDETPEILDVNAFLDAYHFENRLFSSADKIFREILEN
ncbi:MAG: ImmA/IrrE family metallo-endopeptidase [Streptococcaceae bacterium]|jgi:hypothetical protein|nr:ImmA/IrrE family metallo-endopeptidase [Streptococcaceae bacterium]